MLTYKYILLVVYETLMPVCPDEGTHDGITNHLLMCGQTELQWDGGMRPWMSGYKGFKLHRKKEDKD